MINRKRLTALTVAFGLIATAGASRSAAAASGGAIRKIDFRNFTYESQGGGPKITVVNGVYESHDLDGVALFHVLDVDHGDLDGDGIEEAIVTTVENDGGTGNFTDGTIFRMTNGRPVQIGALGAGDRADGGIFGVTIDRGHIVVDRFGQNGGGACCPGYIEREQFKLRTKGLTQISKPIKRAYIVLSRSEPDSAKIRFLRGSASATIEGDGNLQDTATIDARKGQTVTMSLPKTPRGGELELPRSVKVTLSIGANVIAVATPGATVKAALPSTGRYNLSWDTVSGKRDQTSIAYGDLELTIR